MQTIGEKLEEARKNRGISIREASEVTKIRSEYLGSFESNSFDLNVPEVYIRGFLRAYAKFLKLNSEKIITDYNAHQLGESTFARQKESREFLGRMDIPDQPVPAQAPPAPAIRQQQPASPQGNEETEYTHFDKSSYLKIGGAIAAAGLLVVLVVVGLVAIFRTDPGDAAAAAANSAQTPASAQELTLIANGGDILSITVTEISTGQELFRGPLSEGETQRVPFDEQVRLSYSHAEFLHIEHNGLRYEIGGRGVNRSSFPRKTAQ